MSAWGWVIKLPCIGGVFQLVASEGLSTRSIGRTFTRSIGGTFTRSIGGTFTRSIGGNSLVASEELSLVASEGLSLVAPEGLSTHVYSRGKVFPFRGETSFCLFLFTRMPVLRFGRDANWW